MPNRRIAALFALALGLVPCAAARAADDKAGSATGTLTVNGTPIKLTHAYARKVRGATSPDSDQFELRPPREGETAAEGVFLVLTDAPLPVPDLTYVSSVQSALSDGKVQGISWIVDGKKQAQGQALHHRALSREVPGRPDSFEISRLDARVAGKAGAEADFFDDAWTYEVSFDAPVQPLPAASMQAGTATGTLTVDGKVYQLRHAYARKEPGAFDEKKTDVVLDLLDAPVPEAALKNRFGLRDLVAAGKVHGLSVTIDASGQVISGGFYMPGLEFASSTGWQKLEPVAFDASTLEGRLYSQGEHDLFEHKVTIDARFNVALKK
jgi:hypothetical protein